MAKDYQIIKFTSYMWKAFSNNLLPDNHFFLLNGVRKGAISGIISDKFRLVALPGAIPCHFTANDYFLSLKVPKWLRKDLLLNTVAY